MGCFDWLTVVDATRDALSGNEPYEFVVSIPFDHVAINHSQLYRPLPRVTSND